MLTLYNLHHIVDILPVLAEDHDPGLHILLLEPGEVLQNNLQQADFNIVRGYGFLPDVTCFSYSLSNFNPERKYLRE